MFDLRTARYFVALGEELHYGRAAKRLHMSQSPLSQAIIRLERDVGATLVERNNRRVSLTPAGEAFLVECRVLLEHADAVAQTPKLVAAGTHSRLTIGAVASAFSWPLPGVLATLQTAAPTVAVDVQEVDSDEIDDLLIQRRIDVGLGRLSTSGRGIETRMLVRDDFVALLPEAHPSASSSASLALAELAEAPWVWLPREISPDYHDAMTSACRAAGFRVRPRHWVRSIASQIALVSAGVGVTIIPGTAATDLPASVRARLLSDAHPAVVLSASNRTSPTSLESLFLACVSDVLEAVPPARLGSLSTGV